MKKETHTFEVTYKDGQKHIVETTRKNITAFIGCKNDNGNWAYFMTSQDAQKVLNKEMKLNRPWLSDFHIATTVKL